VVVRCIYRLKPWRGIATRDEKRAVNYRATIFIASVVLWLDACFVGLPLIVGRPVHWND
jgi:transposase